MASSGNKSVSAADAEAPVSAAEAERLFSDLCEAAALMIAVSGGPDSTALLFLLARWRRRRKSGPKLHAVTIDHGLRLESAREAAAVKRLARKLGVSHRTLRWTGRKPATGLQQAARAMRYRLLTEAARKAGARHILTAHTLDDQAETVILRMARGSGLSGLAAIARVTDIGGLDLVRPLLDIPKARLIATLNAARIPYVEDPSNRDPRFARARLRELMPALAREGLTASRLAMLARRVRRAEAALEAAVAEAADHVSLSHWIGDEPVALDARRFAELPQEVALRLLGRAIARLGDEGPVELAKLETLHAALSDALAASARFRRTLAGASVTGADGRIVIERAPPRRGRSRPGLNQKRTGRK
jgi:tRNA(Ile)-lysidine synthase